MRDKELKREDKTRPAKFYRIRAHPTHWSLRQLEEEGTVKSAWETSGSGPARRVYSITDAGEAYLDFWADALKQYRRNIDAFFRLYRGFVGVSDGHEKGRRVGEAAQEEEH